MAQGINVNHIKVLLQQDTEYVIHMYFYTGVELEKLEFRPDFQIIDCRIEKFFYDFWVTFSTLRSPDKNSLDYTRIFKVLDQAANLVCLSPPIAANIMTVWRRRKNFCNKNFIRKPVEAAMRWWIVLGIPM